MGKRSRERSEGHVRGLSCADLWLVPDSILFMMCSCPLLWVEAPHPRGEDKTVYFQLLVCFYTLQTRHSKRITGKFFILKWLLQSFSFQTVLRNACPQYKIPAMTGILSGIFLKKAMPASIAGEVGILRHAIVPVWSGNFDDWGLTSGFAGVSGQRCRYGLVGCCFFQILWGRLGFGTPTERGVRASIWI
jgi:hypothetical protein